MIALKKSLFLVEMKINNRISNINFQRHSNIKFELGDVRNLGRVREVCRRIDIIFHAAALMQVPNNEIIHMKQ